MEEALWEGGCSVLQDTDSGCPWPHLHLLINIDNLLGLSLLGAHHPPNTLGSPRMFAGAGGLRSHYNTDTQDFRLFDDAEASDGIRGK